MDRPFTGVIQSLPLAANAAEIAIRVAWPRNPINPETRLGLKGDFILAAQTNLIGHNENLVFDYWPSVWSGTPIPEWFTFTSPYSTRKDAISLLLAVGTPATRELWRLALKGVLNFTFAIQLYASDGHQQSHLWWSARRTTEVTRSLGLQPINGLRQ